MKKKTKKIPYQTETWRNPGGLFVKEWVNPNSYRVYRIKDS